MQFKCPDCSSREISEDEKRGERSCADCGLVISENMIDPGQDWNDFDGGNTEQRLSWLCWRIIQLDASGDDYGLRLPNVEIPLAAGDRQREVTLRALALYDMQPPGTGYHL